MDVDALVFMSHLCPKHDIKMPASLLCFLRRLSFNGFACFFLDKNRQKILNSKWSNEMPADGASCVDLGLVLFIDGQFYSILYIILLLLASNDA